MPSPLAETLAERLLSHFPPDRAYDRVALEAAASEESAPALPRTVRHFIERMMVRRIDIERDHLRVLRQPWLDHEHPDVRHAEERLLAAVRQHVRIPAEAWERVLRHACERVAAYLVRPVPALEDFVFGEGFDEGAPQQQSAPQQQGDADPSDAVPADVVQRRLGYFAAYAYLRKATSAYVEQHDVHSFQREHLMTLLRRVDERMCADYDTEGWLRLLQPLFALARTAYPDHDGIPVDVLESFFEEKKADQPLRRLRTARSEHDLAVVSPAALQEILNAAPAPASPAEEEPPPEAEPVSEAEPAPEEEEEEAVPLWKQFQHASGAAGEPTTQVSPSSANDADDGSSASARPRWQQFNGSRPEERADASSRPASSRPASSEPASSEQPTDDEPPDAAPPLRPLEEEVLGHAADNRSLFVRELFDDSRDAYERVLHRLRDAENWSAATQIIARDVFRAHGVNIYSDAARSFTNAVEARFR
jgi:hypothetical protein